MVVPTAGVEGMPFKRLDPRNPGQLGLVQWPTRHDHEARLEHIAATGGDGPASCFLTPTGLVDSRLEAGPFVQIELLADPLGVGKDLRGEGVSFLRDVAGLFEQRKIEIPFDVTLRAGIAVPVPGP